MCLFVLQIVFRCLRVGTMHRTLTVTNIRDCLRMRLAKSLHIDLCLPVEDSLKEAYIEPWRVIIHTHKSVYQHLYLVWQSRIAENIS